MPNSFGRLHICLTIAAQVKGLGGYFFYSLLFKVDINFSKSSLLKFINRTEEGKSIVNCSNSYNYFRGVFNF